jgi:Zn-dependent alcohol dehydrogenase
VSGVKPGDDVVLTFIPGCGTCRWCRRGLHHFCAEGPALPRARSWTAPTDAMIAREPMWMGASEGLAKACWWWAAAANRASR